MPEASRELVRLCRSNSQDPDVRDAITDYLQRLIIEEERLEQLDRSSAGNLPVAGNRIGIGLVPLGASLVVSGGAVLVAGAAFAGGCTLFAGGARSKI